MGIPTTHNTMGDCMSTSESIAAAPSPPLSRPIAADSDRVPLLEDNTVTLAPYFTVHDVDKFKAIWRADYAQFAHKEDCVHYAFTFSDDNHAHCREAYINAAAVLQHLTDVDAPLKAVLDPTVAKLDKLEVHGPAAELDQLREALDPLGAAFYTCEWGFRPAHEAMAEDTVVHLYPYFRMKDVAEFKRIWGDAYAATKGAAEAEKSHQYAFSFEGDNMASCRESYGDAEGVLLHLGNVDVPLKAVLDGPADLDHLEVHGPATEIEKLKPALGPLGAQFFVTGWGFRNATA